MMLRYLGMQHLSKALLQIQTNWSGFVCFIGTYVLLTSAL